MQQWAKYLTYAAAVFSGNTNAIAETLSGSLTVNGTGTGLTVAHDASVGGNLGVTGTITGGTYNGQTIANPASFTGNLAIAGTVTGGTYNGQTISSAASFTGSLTVASTITVNTGGSTIKGGVTISAPTSGNSLTVNAVATGAALRLLQSTGVNQSLENSTTDLMFQVRPYSGKNGWLAFTEDAVADRWLVGTKGGDGTLYFASGNVVSNTVRASLSSTGLLQAADDGGTLQAVGWRGTPFNVQAGSYTAALADRGKFVDMTTAGTTLTVPANVFSQGDAFTIGAGFLSGSITIAQGAGVTMNWANGTNTVGNRTLTGVGLATIIFTSATSCWITGSALS